MTEAFEIVMTANRYRDTLEHERALLDARFPGVAVTIRGTSARSDDDIVREGAKADAIMLSTLEPVTAALLDRLPRVRVVGRYGVGLDNVDLDAATERGVVVTHYPAYCTDEVADHALSMILALNRQIVALDQRLRRGHWLVHRSATRTLLPQPVPALRESTLGIIGFGRIGRAVATRARAFGLSLLVHDPHLEPDAIQADGIEPAGFREVFERSDLVTIHCPLTTDTLGLVNADALDRMKSTAYVVNTARGPIVDLPALVTALQAGTIAGAALDVTYPEPLPADSPLYTLPNVILTPHSAYYSERSTQVVRDETFASVMMALLGLRPPVVANPGVLGRVPLASP